ncbi:MAG: hypothetical protein IGS23_14195 [Rivularia sp. T60_A2020_040]|nr:hypothetical protein [Rivularia sp. T60_A2020_040]
MTNPNYSNMSKAELRAALLKNPQNTELFHAYIDKSEEENPNKKILSAEEAIAEIKKKVNRGS